MELATKEMTPQPVQMTKKEMRRAIRDKYYSLNLDLTKSVKSMFREVEDESAGNVFAALMAVLANENPGEEAISVAPDTLQQMALLAAQSLSRHIMERYS